MCFDSFEFDTVNMQERSYEERVQNENSQWNFIQDDLVAMLVNKTTISGKFKMKAT